MLVADEPNVPDQYLPVLVAENRATGAVAKNREQVPNLEGVDMGTDIIWIRQLQQTIICRISTSNSSACLTPMRRQKISAR